MTIHLLRYDDFSTCSSNAVEERLIAVFSRHRIPCTFSVIPYVCDPESLLSDGDVKLRPLPKSKADLLKPLLKEGLAEIALHGYAHLALSEIRGHQEFSPRMPKEIQRKLIRKGRQFLEDVFGVRVRLYIPPWNWLTPLTATVLREEDFLLSGNMPDPDCSAPAQLPCATGIAETTCALKTARWFGKGRNSIGTMIHDYDFFESNLGTSDLKIAQFEEILCRWKSMNHVEHQLISKAILEVGESGDERIRGNRALIKAVNGSRVVRRFFSGSREIYWDTATAFRLANIIKYLP